MSVPYKTKLSSDGSISMNSKVSLHPRRHKIDKKEWLPSKESIATVRNRLYVNSNTGYIFGKMLRDLKVRLCTNSHTLSNKSLTVVGGKAVTHATRISHVPRTLFSRAFPMIRMMTSWTCARISGEESIDETICRIVGICLTGFLSITHHAEGLCDTHPHVGLVIVTISIHQRFQVIALGCTSLFVSTSCNRRLYDSHCRLLEIDTAREGDGTHEARCKLCRDGQEFVLEMVDHTLHTATEDIKIRLVGELQ
jgi:hypothetical protein